MTLLRHFLHPVRASKSIYRRAHRYASTCVYKKLAAADYRAIPRARREQCWCGGALLPFQWHATYGVCAECGCYVNQRPPLQETLTEVYSLERYWRRRQKMRGYLPIEARGEQYKAEGRIDYWLWLVERFMPRPGKVIEVGCAPGTLLKELQARGYECLGVEANSGVADWLRVHADVPIQEGLFPGVELPTCDLFLAFDVAEHAPEPLAFWTEMARLLRPRGIAIIQTPIERRDYEHPFKGRPDWFDDLEHLFLFTDWTVRKLASLVSLPIIALEDALGELGQVCVLRKPDGCKPDA